MKCPSPATFNMFKRCSVWIAVVVTIVFLIAAWFCSGNLLKFDNEPVADFSNGWNLLDETGKPVLQPTPLHLPAILDTGDTVSISKTIPDDLPTPAVLCFRTSHQFVRLYCDDTLLYSFGYDDEPLFGKSPGSAWNLVRLPQGIGGKELILELHTPYPSYNGRIAEIKIGSKASLLFFLLRQHGFSLVLTLAIFVVSIVTLIIYWLVIRKDASTGKETLYLGLFALFVSLWMFGESRLTQFFSIPPGFVTCFTFVFMTATPIPLVQYIACGRAPQGQRLLGLVNKLLYGLVVGCVLLQAFNVFDYIQLLPIIHTFLGIASVALLYTVVSDMILHRGQDIRRLVLSLGILVFFFILETLNLYLTTRSVGDMMRIGVLIFIAIQAQIAFKNALKMMQMSRLASVDALTNCLNRTAYTQRLAELDDQSGVGVVIVDINDLKVINDTYGHDTGDDAIIRCANCFSEAYSPYGRCFRIGGDEFALLGKNLSMDRLYTIGVTFEALTSAERENVKYPFFISYGYAVYNPLYDKRLTDTVRRADKMMYNNKRELKRRYSPDASVR